MQKFANAPSWKAILVSKQKGMSNKGLYSTYSPAQVTKVLNIIEESKIDISKINLNGRQYKSAVKVSGYADVQTRTFKDRFKSFFVECMAKAKNPNGLMVGLSHLFETEKKIIAQSSLNGIQFITYEYRQTKLKEFKKKQNAVLKSNPKLSKRVLKIYYEMFSEMVKVAVTNHYFAVDADYCGCLTTFIDEIEQMLTKNIVVVDGFICLTFKKNSRQFAGVNATEHMKKFLKKFPNYKLIPYQGQDFYEYSDNIKVSGGKMVGCILQRVK